MSYAMQKKDYDKKFLRLVVIIYRLATAGRIRTPELAREFNVALRTVQRDLDLIQQGGFPLIRTPLGWQLVEGFYFPYFFNATRRCRFSPLQSSLVDIKLAKQGERT